METAVIWPASKGSVGQFSTSRGTGGPDICNSLSVSRFRSFSFSWNPSNYLERFANSCPTSKHIDSYNLTFSKGDFAASNSFTSLKNSADMLPSSSYVSCGRPLVLVIVIINTVTRSKAHLTAIASCSTEQGAVSGLWPTNYGNVLGWRRILLSIAECCAHAPLFYSWKGFGWSSLVFI